MYKMKTDQSIYMNDWHVRLVQINRQIKWFTWSMAVNALEIYFLLFSPFDLI